MLRKRVNLISYRKAIMMVFLFFMSFSLKADSTYTIKVHFQYGSKPARGYKQYESRWFGGIHGGHVMIQYGDTLYGFVPYGKFHILAHNKQIHSSFVSESESSWRDDTLNQKYLSFVIPLDSVAYFRFVELQRSYLKQSPYDYAFIGMRCAAASYDLLSVGAGIFKQKGKIAVIKTCFYPKKLRKKLIRLAAKNGYFSYGHKGSSTRKWEKAKWTILNCLNFYQHFM